MKSENLTVTKHSFHRIYLATGRIFFGVGIMGIGMLHFFRPGIRAIIIPDLTVLSPGLHFIVYIIGAALTGTGLFISIGKKYHTLSLIMGIVFLILFLIGHLPKFLAADSFNNYWVNINKVLAISGGFLVVSTIHPPKPNNKVGLFLARMAPLGKYLYAIMLYNFAVGHFNNLKGIAKIVPSYIPFPVFWTYLGGITLMGSAISIFSGFKVEKICLLLAINLFIWLVMLHIYFNVLYPGWQDGENFIGSFTCMCFCGTALIISQTAAKSK